MRCSAVSMVRAAMHCTGVMGKAIVCRWISTPELPFDYRIYIVNSYHNHFLSMKTLYNYALNRVSKVQLIEFEIVSRSESSQ